MSLFTRIYNATSYLSNYTSSSTGSALDSSSGGSPPHQDSAGLDIAEAFRIVFYCAAALSGFYLLARGILCCCRNCEPDDSYTQIQDTPKP